MQGGTDGNEQLTAMTGVLLILLLAGLGVTIVFIGPLLWEHLFLGFLLLGPVLLKMASTGYRFLRYYTAERLYREKGPPPPLLRMLAPLVVVSTVVVFVSGIVLLAVGPDHRNPYVLVHKAGFIVWIAVTALHVLGHLPGLSTSFRGAAKVREDIGIPGTRSRWMALAGAVVAGLVVAAALIPTYGTWTGSRADFHDHHGRHDAH